MPRLSEQARGIAYPQLTADQINNCIEAIIAARAEPEVVSDPDLTDAVLGYLIGFYTKRWGLPPSLQR